MNPDKVKKWLALRKEYADMEATYKSATEPMKEEISTLRGEITQEMKDINMTNVGFEFGTVALVRKNTPKILDERTVIAWLKEKRPDLYKSYVKPRLTTDFETILGDLTKEVVPEGVMVFSSEYLQSKERKIKE